ncbi:MAG: rhomboid family intramembrane serine protease [Nocardioides sp.]|nr:rhomboid family intramembrane serine protease [Nocardioides sp.]
METDTRARPAWQLRQAAVVVGIFVALLWVLEIIDVVSGRRLDAYGVRPRTDEGLIGVVVAPTLHFGFDHLISNTVPVAVLGFLTLATGIARGLLATAIIWVVAGLGVWVVGDSFSNHAGASALVFGWIVYLGVRGFLNRSWSQVALGVVVLVIYGGVLWGVLPGQPGVSWEGHLCGAIGGAVAARLVAVRRGAGALAF